MTKFDEKQKEYIVNILGRRLQCDTQEHRMCFQTQDGRHRQLTEQDIAEWVTELCTGGDATTSKPPEWIMNGTFSRRGSNSSDGGFFEVKPVRSSLSSTSSRRPSGSFSLGSRKDHSQSSSGSSGVPGVGYYSGKVLRWIGEKSINAIEEALILKCGHQHRSCLRQWRKSNDLEDTPEEFAAKREKLFLILGDALELSGQDYPFRWKRVAFLIGMEVQLWLKNHRIGPFTKERAGWLALVQLCLLPLLLSRISRTNSRAEDLSAEIRAVLVATPLRLHNSETISPAICIVIRELTYFPYTSQYSQHSWLGVDLRSIINTILQARPLKAEELGAIRDMLERRISQNDSRMPGTCRPWEVPIFADCADQDSSFLKSVLGPHGVESLLFVLRNMVDEHSLNGEMEWAPLSLILRAIAFLSQHPWITQLVTPGVTLLLLDITSLTVPEKWFCIRFWAMDSIRNVVSHHPSTLRTLPIENARDAFTSMLFTPGSSTSTSTTTALADYRKEADDCAKYLLDRVARWDADRRRSTNLAMKTSDIPPRLSLSGPSEDAGASPMPSSASPMDMIDFIWEDHSAQSQVTGDSMDTFIADHHVVAPKLSTDPLPATGGNPSETSPGKDCLTDGSTPPPLA